MGKSEIPSSSIIVLYHFSFEERRTPNRILDPRVDNPEKSPHLATMVHSFQLQYITRKDVLGSMSQEVHLSIITRNMSGAPARNCL